MSPLPMILIECQVFPSPHFFAWMLQKRLMVEACEHYQKRSARNRFLLQESDRTVILSVPLCKGKNEGMPVREVRISYDHTWVRSTLATIATLYGRSPFYPYYKDELAEMFASRPALMFDFNRMTQQWLAAQFSVPFHVELTSRYDRPVPEGVTEMRDAFRQRFNRGMAAQAGALPATELSALHLLFHEGPEAILSISRLAEGHAASELDKQNI